MPGTSPAQDPDFLSASPQDQHAYLMATDPDYAKASPQDQAAYRSSLADPIGQKAKAAASAAGVSNPGVSTPPLTGQMNAAGLRHQQLEMKRGQYENFASRSPTPVTNAANVMLPAAGISDLAATEGVKGILPWLGKAAAKSAATTVGGAAIGGAVGAPFGQAKRGAEIGGGVGLAAGPFIPDTRFANAPWGMNRAILGEEGLADARASQRMAQIAANQRAGLAPSQNEIISERKPWGTPTPEPSPFQGMTSTAYPIGDAEVPPATGNPPASTGNVVPQFVKQYNQPEPSRIVSPDSPPPDVKVTYQSAPQAELRKMVMAGDKEAILEWQRRSLPLPPNVGYMVEPGAGTLPWRRYAK